jgi:predicted Zn-dependent protease
VLNRLGQNDKAEAYLRQAAALEPGNAVPQLNLGMLLAEMKRPAEAEAAFRAAVAADPKSAQAAYNLGLLLARDRAAEAIEWLQTAHQLRPAEPRYAYALAFHLNGAGRAAQAAEVLLELMNTGAADAATYALLGQVYQTQGKTREALEVYRRAAGNIALSERDRADFAARLGAIPPR